MNRRGKKISKLLINYRRFEVNSVLHSKHVSGAKNEAGRKPTRAELERRRSGNGAMSGISVNGAE